LITIEPKSIQKIVFAEADHLDAKGSQIVLDEGIGHPFYWVIWK
jgi:hypothetical protein